MNIAKWIVAFVAVYGFGGLVVDAIVPATAKQHLWNPRWPPHAKFHNCQTMLMGIFSGTVSLVLLFGFRPLTLPVFFVATASAASYWVSMTFAQAFPGTAWYDPEFKDLAPRPYGLSPQQILTYVLCALLVVASALAARSTGS